MSSNPWSRDDLRVVYLCEGSPRECDHCPDRHRCELWLYIEQQTEGMGPREIKRLAEGTTGKVRECILHLDMKPRKKPNTEIISE